MVTDQPFWNQPEDPGSTIYLDHAATTPVDDVVLEAMIPYFTRTFGNPSSVHSSGRDARAGIDWSRGTIANILNCRPREIVFTSGATEANNLAVKGQAWAYRAHHPDAPGHIITTAIEHHAILHAVEALAEFGFEYSIVPVDESGIVQPDDVAKAIRPDTCLITVMYANNEVGTIQPIRDIAKIAAANEIPFHSDAVQAAGALDLDIEVLGADMISLSAHKFYGPKGMGVLVIKDDRRLSWQIHGGGQELTRRAGTENVPGIVGMATALQNAASERAERMAHVQCLRDRLADKLLERVPDSQINGDMNNRLPNNLNISFRGVDGESILVDLDLNGVAASSGSACASGSNEPSHVLRAIGLSDDLAEGSLRLTTGKDNTVEEIDRAVEVIALSVERIRSLLAT